MASPQPKPTYLKLLTGNPGKRALNKNEPAASKSLPRPPSWLNGKSKAIFKLLVKRLDEMGYASASHTESLALAAWRLDQVKECARIIEAEGLTYEFTAKNGSSQKLMRPEVRLQGEAAKHAQSLLNEFGLTPSSATRVQVPGKAKSNAFNAI